MVTADLRAPQEKLANGPRVETLYLPILMYGKRSVPPYRVTS